MLKYILIVGLFLFQQNLFSQSTLESWSEERTSLLAAYKEKPQKALVRKINKLENQVVDYIHTNGYPVTLKLPKGTEKIEVRDKCYPVLGKVISTLKNNEQILVLDKDRYGYFKVKVNGQVGYVYNIATTPKLEEYPLQLLTQVLKEEEVVNALISYPSFSNIAPQYPSASQCSSNTSVGKRCLNMTSNNNGRCHIH